MCGAEGDHLHFGEVVGGVAVEDHFADGDEGEVALGPHFGHVERVEGHLFRLGEGHYLKLAKW